MADTFYKYQPQAPSTNVNWAEVSKNFTDILSDEVRVRDEKKAAINEGTRELQRTLNTTEQGLHGTANQWMLKGAAEIQEVMSMQDRLLQNGSLRLSDYTVMRQNLVDGTDGMLALFKKFNTEYEERMARASDAGGAEGAQSQELEAWGMKQVEGFANFSSSAYIVNPETGTGSVGMIGDDGEVSRNPNDLRSVASLNGMMGQQYDYYDLEESTQAMAADLGETSEIFRTYGGQTAKGLITKVSSNNWRGKNLTDEDLETLGMSGEEGEMLNMYTASENQFISTIMSDMYHTSSILTNNIYEAGNGENYTFTFDEDRGENEILLTIDPITGAMVPTYTEEQEEDVKNAIRTSLRSKLDSTTETSVVSDYTPEPRNEVETKEQEEIDRGLATDWSRIWYGLPAEKSAALESLFGTEDNQDLQGFDFNDEGDIVLDYADDSKDRIIKVGTAANYEDFLRTGTEVTGIANGDRIIELAGAIPEGRVQVKGAPGLGASRGADALVPIVVAKKFTANAMPTSVYTAGVSEDKAAAAINAAYSSYGIKATHDTDGYNEVSIKRNLNFGTNKDAEWVEIGTWNPSESGTDGEDNYNAAMGYINGVIASYDTEIIQQISAQGGSGELD